MDEVGTWENVTYSVIGREVGANGTPHLQGFVIFQHARALRGVRTRLRGRAHWEITRGTAAQASDYCKKDGNFIERGELPRGQGARSDLRRLREWVDEFIEANRRAPTDAEWALHQFDALVRYPRIVESARLRASALAPVELQRGEPRPWQHELAHELSLDADDRSILFYVDEEGNSGKTWFQKWMFTEHPDAVQLLGVGKRDDMAYMVDETKWIFLVNVPRGGMEFLQYTVLEQLKDRYIASPKYASRVKVLGRTPHVAVFCNEDPDFGKLSADRYIVRKNFNDP